MEHSLALKRGVLLVHAAGELDMHAAAALRSSIDQRLADSGVKKLALNLAEVSFIDSSGLGVILGRYKHLHSSGGKVVIIKAQPQVKQILALAGILKIMDLYASEAEALANL